MKKAIKCTFILMVLCQFSFAQKIILVNGEAVKVKIDAEEIIEIVDTKIKNYMNDFETTSKTYFKKEDQLAPKQKEIIIKKDNQKTI